MKPYEDKAKPKTDRDETPDGRGPHPTDPNEAAKWIVEQTTGDDNQDNAPESTA